MLTAKSRKTSFFGHIIINIRKKDTRLEADILAEQSKAMDRDEINRIV